MTTGRRWRMSLRCTPQTVTAQLRACSLLESVQGRRNNISRRWIVDIFERATHRRRHIRQTHPGNGRLETPKLLPGDGRRYFGREPGCRPTAIGNHKPSSFLHRLEHERPVPWLDGTQVDHLGIDVSIGKLV